MKIGKKFPQINQIFIKPFAAYFRLPPAPSNISGTDICYRWKIAWAPANTYSMRERAVQLMNNNNYLFIILPVTFLLFLSDPTKRSQK
jgi:hypothetical protein